MPRSATDHRGRAVKICKPKALRGRAPYWTRWLASTSDPWFFWGIAMFVPLTLGGVILSRAYMISRIAAVSRTSGLPPPDTRGFYAVPVAGVVFMGGQALAIFLLQPTFRRAAVRRILRLRLCPACAYDLGAAPTADDGCSVCPECGAAWKLAKNETGRT
jgi:hypothetical protein